MCLGLVKLTCIGAMVGLAACGSSSSSDSGVGSRYEIALVTDNGNLNDMSFNQEAWESVVAFAEPRGTTHQHYTPPEESTTAYGEAIDLAVANGAKVVVTPGYFFEEAIYLSQTSHPAVHFILLDGEPHTADDQTYRTDTNVQPILYAEQQAGYLAGYAAVKDGYRSLGFMGGASVPAVVRYGMGFSLGANDAAIERQTVVALKYHYTGSFIASPEVQSLATTWYEAGTEVIFACGGTVGLSVMTAAASQGKKVIGVDVDQHHDSSTVITSAMKGVGASVLLALAAHYDGTWVGGTTWNLDASNNGVGLPTATASWGFSNFTLAEYDTIYGKLADKTVVVTVNTSYGIDAAGIALFNVSLPAVILTFES